MAPIERKTCTAPDGVVIAYSVAGAGDPAIVFIHGGLANRTFWDESMMILSERHRIVAPDLPGHGESGTNRTQWGVPEFGADVRAVVLAEGLQRVVLVGNSLGGPVAIEAALLMPRRVLTVVGVDTFHRLAYGVSAEESRRRAEAFRADFVGSLKQMVAGLFHRDADPALVADAERRMAGTSPKAATQILLSLGGYAPKQAAELLAVPLRAINGDLHPVDIDGVRETCPDFRVRTLTRVGHYPMLERPREFAQLVEEVIGELTWSSRRPAPLAVI